MKSVPKLIRRYIRILILSCILILVLNLGLLAAFAASQSPNVYPWQTAKEVAASLQQADNGCYVLSDDLALALKNSQAWAILIDNETKQVIWQTDNLPETIPASYTLSDIADLTRGYIDGYPTFPGNTPKGLVVLGYPRDRFWKHMWPSWDYDTIANLPWTILTALAINIALIFLIYVTANSRLLKSVRPIINGIQNLPLGEAVYVREKGLLSELARSINQTSEMLQFQNYQLRRKERARANWIAGVSHDIRTPLSMVMGYAGQLKESPCLTPDAHKKAAVIVRQSQRIRDLINDLNLASKLEYNMQPIHLGQENLIAIARQVVVDFINIDIQDRHPIVWETEETFVYCPVKADRDLVRRAISNLIQNSINHNEQGCRISVSVTADTEKCNVLISDDGIGITDENLEKLKSSPHYMVCDEAVTSQRHGLGLLIVKQIMDAHGGTVHIGHSPHGGFLVRLEFPQSV